MASKLKNNYLPEFAKLLGLQKQPSMVTVNLTNQCNQNCIYCEIGKVHPGPFDNALNFEDMQWLVDEMKQHKIRKLSLCGGEPFLFHEIIHLVEYAGIRGVRCTITSNGMNIHMLNKEEFAVLRKNKTEINISIDSFQEEVQTLVRGSSKSLSKALLSVKELQKNMIPVTVLTVISKYNFYNLFENVEYAVKHGIRQILFQPVINWTNYPDMEALSGKEKLNISGDDLCILKGQLKKILYFEKRNRINTNVYRLLPWIFQYLDFHVKENKDYFFSKLLAKFYCRDVYSIIDISYTGGIQPCCLTPSEVSIRNHKGLDLISLWSNATSGIRDRLEKEEFFNYCNSCCNHFSRNMLASIMRYPLENRKALYIMAPILFSRLFVRFYKRLFIN